MRGDYEEQNFKNWRADLFFTVYFSEELYNGDGSGMYITGTVLVFDITGTVLVFDGNKL